MDANTIKEQLTTEDIIKIVTEGLGSAGNIWDAANHPIFQTVCHGGDSYKLYYYPETKLFFCYTQCSDSFDLFELVRRAKQYGSFVEALNYVKEFFHLNGNAGFDAPETELSGDWDILNKVEYYQSIQEPKPELVTLNENILTYFGPLAVPTEWERDRIGMDSTYKFGIRVDAAMHKIIIPHRDQNGNLVGIRGRSFDPIEVADGKKYMPVFCEGTCYKHPLGNCLYGLYENMDAIKRHKKVMLVESEKSVLQCYEYYHDDCFAVATCGSSLSAAQIDLLLHLGVEEVILAYDRENDTDPLSELTKSYEEKLLKLVQPLAKYVNVYIIFDYDGLLPYKASPSDMGKETLEQLMHKKIYISSLEQPLNTTTRKKKQ